jgi:hypothetical protein
VASVFLPSHRRVMVFRHRCANLPSLTPLVVLLEPAIPTSPIRCMGTSMGDGWREFSRRRLVAGARPRLLDEVRPNARLTRWC